ncbi:MAG: protein kinase, partial [Gammaproteobacteria bacterium]|nr:protein kinase [Gammaproteobacteria bacterium]
EENPLREVRYGQFLEGAWILGLSPFLILLLQHISIAVGLGREEARRLIAAAERVARSDPEQSAHLYRTAQGLMLDAERPRASTGNKTQVISRSRGHAQAPSHVGPDERYRIDTALGSGGMGVVYAGTDTRLERPVALKQLFDHLVTDAEHLERFRQEALALASLAHSHIVTIYDLLEHEGHFWIVMELLNGGSLAEQIKAQGRIPVERCIEITCDVADGLDCAHAHGIVHRDIKPLNILFMADGQTKLTDFGNAKLNESIVHTREGLMMGSPSFMSPEQVDGSPVDLRTDIYSLGITLYQMLTGKVPFEGELNSVLAQHVNKPPRPPSELAPAVPAALDAVVLKMLAKAPEDRFQDCKATITALRAVAG